MLSCPRCGSGYLEEGQSITMHLPQYCQVQVYCVIHKETYCQQNIVMIRCSQDLIQQLFNKKLGTSICGEKMFLFLLWIHYMACHLYCIYSSQHNQNWKIQMCITLGLTLTYPHQHLLRINQSIMTIQLQILSLKNTLFEKYCNTIRLPPNIAFQVHLLSQMNEHRGNDLNMFN
jgi:hypothetical protein